MKFFLQVINFCDEDITFEYGVPVKDLPGYSLLKAVIVDSMRVAQAVRISQTGLWGLQGGEDGQKGKWNRWRMFGNFSGISTNLLMRPIWIATKYCI